MIEVIFALPLHPIPQFPDCSLHNLLDRACGGKFPFFGNVDEGLLGLCPAAIRAGDAERIAEDGLIPTRKLLEGGEDGRIALATQIDLLGIQFFTARETALVQKILTTIVGCCLLDAVGMTKGCPLDQQRIDLCRRGVQFVCRVPQRSKIALAAADGGIINAVDPLQHAEMPRTFDRKAPRAQPQIIAKRR